MKIELLIFVITGFLIYDTYHEGKFSQKILSGKKYFKMIAMGFIGLSLLVLISVSAGNFFVSNAEYYIFSYFLGSIISSAYLFSYSR